MLTHPYVMEKLMELETRPAIHSSPREVPPRPRRANGLARSVGRVMRRTGEALEAWAGPNGCPPDYSCPDARHY